MSGASLPPAAVRACLGVMLGMHRVDGSDGSELETLFVVYTASSVICILCCLFTILCFLCIRPLRPDYVNRVVFIISVIECLYGMAQLLDHWHGVTVICHLQVFMFQLYPIGAVWSSTMAVNAYALVRGKKLLRGRVELLLHVVLWSWWFISTLVASLTHNVGPSGALWCEMVTVDLILLFFYLPHCSKLKVPS